MAFDWLVLREGASLVKYAPNCFWVIHVSTAAGEAEETAACMYIHSCRLGMAGEVMCLSSVSDCQNKVHTVLQLHCCTVASGEPVAFGGNVWARVLCDKIIAVYEFTCLLWDTFWGLRKQLAGKREAATPEYSTTRFFSHSLHFSRLLKWLIGSVALIT